MILNLGSLSFNADIDGGGGTPAWGTEMGQGDGYKFNFEDVGTLMTGLIYNSIPDINNVTCPLGKGGQQRSDYEFVIASLFKKVYVNGLKVKDAEFLLLVVKKLVGAHHVGRRTLKYNPRMTYNGNEVNEDCYRKVEKALGLNEGAAWFINEINIKNQDELHFIAYVMSEHSLGFEDSEKRKKAYLDLIRADRRISGSASHHSTDKPGEQTIFYGCPGTGKSYEVKKIAEGESGDDVIWYEPATPDNKECRKIDWEPTDEEKKYLANNVFRTTFHPDYDYATFVGCYKPTKNDAGDLDYKFIPQVFTNAYISALRHPEDPTYLIIEEINRGNCAQIFGDLFQLLDRTNGESDYEIKPDTELAKYLKSEGVPSESLKLPANLHLYATMNTSDQSLFPMDSAFKRRWAMEYKPIAYSGTKADKFTITIGKKCYQWIQFLKMVNEQILAATESEDKQMGEFFIKDSVSEKEFINKVMFYLWNDVCKDYYRPLRVQAQYFMRVKNKLDGEKNDFFTFAELFGEKNDGNRLIHEFMLYLESKYKEKHADFALQVEDVKE